MQLKARLAKLEKQTPQPDPVQEAIKTMSMEELALTVAVTRKLAQWQQTAKDQELTEAEAEQLEKLTPLLEYYAASPVALLRK